LTPAGTSRMDRKLGAGAVSGPVMRTGWHEAPRSKTCEQLACTTASAHDSASTPTSRPWMPPQHNHPAAGKREPDGNKATTNERQCSRFEHGMQSGVRLWPEPTGEDSHE